MTHVASAGSTTYKITVETSGAATVFTESPGYFSQKALGYLGIFDSLDLAKQAAANAANTDLNWSEQ